MRLTAAVIALMTLGYAVSVDAQSPAPGTHADALPSSWNEFATKFTMTGMLGTWVTRSTTKEMWVGIPAGLKYTETGTVSFSGDGKAVMGRYTMILENGTLISTGTHVIAWDKNTGTVVRTNSGFDLGKPYHGTSTLTALDGGSVRWKYTEKSQGKTTTYDQRLMWVGFNERHNTIRKLPDGKPWNTTVRRANPFADATKTFDLNGTWEMATPDGGKLVSVHTLELGGRVMHWSEHHVDPTGKKTPTSKSSMWWDGATDSIRFHSVNASGEVVSGELVSLTHKGDAATLVSRNRGSDSEGNVTSATITRTVQGDTLTVTVSAFSSEATPVTPPWVGTAMVWKRTSANTK